MKNQSIILMLSFTALALCPSIKAMEDKFPVVGELSSYHNTQAFKELDHATQMRLLEQADKQAEIGLNDIFKVQDQFQDQLRSTLQQSLLDPLPPYGIPLVQSYDENDPELQEALLLSLSSIPNEEAHQQEIKEQLRSKEEYAGMKEALAESLLDAKKERKEKKKSLIKSIVELHPQAIVLREDKKELEGQESDAWKKYYENKDLPNSEEKRELWSQLCDKKREVSLKLNEATSGLNSMIERYLALISDQVKQEDKNPKSERWQEKKRLEQGLRDVRSEIAKLREELQKKEGEVSEKRNLWIKGEGTWEIFNKSENDASNLQLELDSAIAQESERIAAYFMFVHKIGVPSVNSSDKF